jgi:hypothetical protein
MPTTKQYAILASDSYDQPNMDIDNTNLKKGEDPPIHTTLDGRKYYIIANDSNNQTGYQGTIYQDKNTHEIIVAHRGTEPSSAKDLHADGQMVSERNNMQIPDAMALVERAKAYAEKWHGLNPSEKTPEVTVTGHSLGGALAQVTAYKFGLRGETFNSYGAAELKGMPKNAGHNQMTNHVISTDGVSAAAPHFGDVKIYTRAADVGMLTSAGYGKYNLIPDSPKTLAVASAGASHLMKYYTGKDSVLNDPQAQQRSQNHATAINEYRKDVHDDRAIVQATIEGLQTGSHKAQQAMQQLQSTAQKVTTTVEHKTQQVTTAVTHAAKSTVGAVGGVVGRTAEALSSDRHSGMLEQMHRLYPDDQKYNPATKPEVIPSGGWESTSDASKYLPAAHKLQASATEKVQELYLNQGFDFNSQSGEAYAKAAATLAAKHNMPSIDFISHDGQNLHIAFYSKDALNIPTFASINTQEVFTQGQTADAHTLAATMQNNETQAQAQREARTPEQSHARSMSV